MLFVENGKFGYLKIQIMYRIQWSMVLGGGGWRHDLWYFSWCLVHFMHRILLIKRNRKKIIKMFCLNVIYIFFWGGGGGGGGANAPTGGAGLQASSCHIFVLAALSVSMNLSLDASIPEHPGTRMTFGHYAKPLSHTLGMPSGQINALSTTWHVNTVAPRFASLRNNAYTLYVVYANLRSP